ncbi:MAG: sugar O-acetyltransferase, partial [Candidatus Aenigmatarchaeota archaeon]
IPRVTIGDWSIIGAGTTVIKDVPPFSVVVGNPGKVIKTIDEKTIEQIKSLNGM